MVDRAEAAARTKQELPDITNALLEEPLGSPLRTPPFCFHYSKLAGLDAVVG